MGLMSERRGARRYDLSLPVMVRIPAQGFVGTQNGKTRDISTRGLYFVIDQNVRAGSELDIMLTLPRESILDGGPHVGGERSCALDPRCMPGAIELQQPQEVGQDPRRAGVPRRDH